MTGALFGPLTYFIASHARFHQTVIRDNSAAAARAPPATVLYRSGRMSEAGPLTSQAREWPVSRPSLTSGILASSNGCAVSGE